MSAKILVSKRLFPEAIDYLRQRAEVDYHDSNESCPPAELLARLQDKDGAVTQLTDRFSAKVIDGLPKLKVIANVAVGFDNVDIEAATRRRILVTNTPDVLTETTADLAFALLMAASRRISEAERFLRSGQWRQWGIDLLCGQDIYGKTLGVVGLGRIGQAVARRARGFAMKIVYYDAFRAAGQVETELEARFVSLDALLRESDFVSVHVPLLPETRKLIAAPQLALMKKTAVLVNTSRGPVIDEAALAHALKAQQIAAAGLDVFEREPQVEPALLELDNVVLTPHIASASVETRRRMCMMAAENAMVALEGKRPPNLVNPAAFEAA